MKKIITLIILPALIIFVGYAIYSSIQEPVEFNREKSTREKVAIQRLKDIRTLQVAYRGQNGQYTSSIDSLIDFYKNGSITIIKQIGSFDDSLAVAQNRVRRDSIKVAVKDTLLKRADFILEDLRTVPFSDGKAVEMEAIIKKVSGVNVPLFEANMPYPYLLNGLNHQLQVNLKAEREDIGKYNGLRVGSIDAPNNNAGNWE